jgi:hypothetical protein
VSAGGPVREAITVQPDAGPGASAERPDIGPGASAERPDVGPGARAVRPDVDDARAAGVGHDPDALGRVLQHLPPLSLEELCARPDLQTRVDRKYALPLAELPDLVADLPDGFAVLTVDGRRSHSYESVYFDTADLACYHAAAHGRRRRFKVRTRSYLDTSVCLLEAKTVGGRGETVKRRADHTFGERARLDDEDYLVLRDWLGPDLPDLTPTLVTRYRRSTLVDLDGHGRVTLDAGVRGTAPDGRSVLLADHVVVETKSPAAATAVDRWLWAHGHRPVRLSKYAVELAALQPDLPANRWSRTLRRYY